MKRCFEKLEEKDLSNLIYERLAQEKSMELLFRCYCKKKGIALNFEVVESTKTMWKEVNAVSPLHYLILKLTEEKMLTFSEKILQN